jgi:hypothetical protein
MLSMNIYDPSKLLTNSVRMAYIEEEMSKRKGPKPVDTPSGPADPYAELHNLTNRYKNVKNPADEGNVAGSLSMLTAIPEVDLGMK